MPSRIDIELTSARPDGSWTWRAAGARQPKGTVEGDLVPAGSKAGDVLKAEAEFEIDGIVITSLAAPKDKKRDDSGRIEVIGAPSGPPVTTHLARDERRSGDRRRDRDRRPPREGGRPGRGGGDRRQGGGRRGAETGEGGAPAGAEAGQAPPQSDRGGRPGPKGEGRPVRNGPAGAAGRQRGEGRPRGGAGRPRGGGPAGERPVPAGAAAAAEPRSRARRLNPANTHRAAVLGSLPPEQVPVAEQVLRGGIPAVRTAIHLEREKAAAEGRPGPNADALVEMAEELLPRLKAAEWRDRAEAAARVGDDVALRDLRSVVAGADVARDEESRQLAATLREGLERRVTAMRDEWVTEVTRHLDEGRVVRALRLAARPPDPHSRLPSALADRLSEAAGQAMAPDTPPDRWAALLDAVAASPVRRSVHPAGLPAHAGPDLLRSAHQQSGRVPALAAMLGITIPPPPGPARGAPRRPPPPVRNGDHPRTGE